MTTVTTFDCPDWCTVDHFSHYARAVEEHADRERRHREMTLKEVQRFFPHETPEGLAETQRRGPMPLDWLPIHEATIAEVTTEAEYADGEPGSFSVELTRVGGGRDRIDVVDRRAGSMTVEQAIAMADALREAAAILR